MGTKNFGHTLYVSEYEFIEPFTVIAHAKGANSLEQEASCMLDILIRHVLLHAFSSEARCRLYDLI